MASKKVAPERLFRRGGICRANRSFVSMRTEPPFQSQSACRSAGLRRPLPPHAENPAQGRSIRRDDPQGVGSGSPSDCGSFHQPESCPQRWAPKTAESLVGEGGILPSLEQAPLLYRVVLPSSPLRACTRRSEARAFLFPLFFFFFDGGGRGPHNPTTSSPTFSATRS